MYGELCDEISGTVWRGLRATTRQEFRPGLHSQDALEMDACEVLPQSKNKITIEVIPARLKIISNICTSIYEKSSVYI